MSFLSLFKYWPVSTVHVTHAEESATVELLSSDDNKPTTTTLRDLIEDNVPGAKDGYWYCNSLAFANGHLQTVKAVGNFDNTNQVYYGRRIMKSPTGDSFSVDYLIPGPESQEQWKQLDAYEPEEGLPKHPVRTRYFKPEEVEALDDASIDKPIFITLHGLSGGSHEAYVRATLGMITKKYPDEFDCAVINSRGCNRTKITTPWLFNGVMTDDIRALVKHINRKQPNRKIYLAGYSLGGSILGNYLGQEGDDCIISGAVCLATPWDLSYSSYRLNNTFWGKLLYSSTMGKNLNVLLKHHKDMLSQLDWFREEYAKPPPTSLTEFDTRYTAPMFGFDTAQDYYRHATATNRLGKVRTPLLILNSLDDPIATSEALPQYEVLKNPYIYMVATDGGGHLGWFGNNGYRYYPEVVADFLHALNSKAKDVHANVKPSRRLWKNDRMCLPGVSNEEV